MPIRKREVPDPVPNPGSLEASKLGCKCAILDNEYGRGYMGMPGVFCVTEHCPLHHGMYQHNAEAKATGSPISTRKMSSDLKKYLGMEKEVERLEKRAEQIRNHMDKVWASLTDEEHRFLDSRGAK